MTLPAPADDEAGALAAEVGGDLRRTLRRSLDHVVREWRTALDAVEQRGGRLGDGNDPGRMREYTRAAIDALARIGEEGAGPLDRLGPDDLTWHNLTAEMARDEATGLALWARLKQFAREDRANGKAGAAAVEGYYSRPGQRAQYFAVWWALADGLQPRNGMEWLLIDGMAEAWTLRDRWLHRAVETDSLETIRIERDARQRQGWQTPKLSEVEAVDRAAQMADRCERQFLRLLRAYRDQRRLLGSVVVAAGGQLNVAEQQLNVADGRASDDETA